MLPPEEIQKIAFEETSQVFVLTYNKLIEKDSDEASRVQKQIGFMFAALTIAAREAILGGQSTPQEFLAFAGQAYHDFVRRYEESTGNVLPFAHFPTEEDLADPGTAEGS